MYIHYLLKMLFEGKEGADTYFTKIKSYILHYSSKPFYYNISGLNFNLDEIKHGLLRGNKRNPQAYLRALGGYDERV